MKFVIRLLAIVLFIGAVLAPVMAPYGYIPGVAEEVMPVLYGSLLGVVTFAAIFSVVPARAVSYLYASDRREEAASEWFWRFLIVVLAVQCILPFMRTAP